MVFIFLLLKEAGKTWWIFIAIKEGNFVIIPKFLITLNLDDSGHLYLIYQIRVSITQIELTD